MRIAICDDQQQELQRLDGLLRQYKQLHPAMDFTIDQYLSVDALQKQPVGSYQLFLLDILMPQMSGIEFARMLRADGEQAAVIFITSSPDFTLDAFAVSAAQYLLKPVSESALFEVLDKVIPVLQRRQAGSFMLHTQGGITTLYYHNILFVECARHQAFFHLADGTTVSSKTLRQSFVSYLAPLLADERFLHPHHSYCVNREFVTKLSVRGLELTNGGLIPITKDRFSAIKRSYLNYLDYQMEMMP